MNLHQWFALDPGSGRPVAVARYSDILDEAVRDRVAREKLLGATSWEMFTANAALNAFAASAQQEVTVARAYELGARDALAVVRGALEIDPEGDA